MIVVLSFIYKATGWRKKEKRKSRGKGERENAIETGERWLGVRVKATHGVDGRG